MTLEAAISADGKLRPSGHDAHFFLIGGSRARSASLTKAVGKLGFKYSLHFLRNVDNAVLHLKQLRAERLLASPDLIILMQAAMMPSGSRALARLRSNYGLETAPVVVITTVDDPTLRKTLLSEGVCAVVPEHRLGEVAQVISDAIVDNWFKSF